VNWRAYQEQLGEPPRLRLVDDESAAEWVAHAIAAHNRSERNRRVAKEVAIIFGVLACALGAFLMWGIG
jgi:predicted HNH restriction endonuclease